MKTAIELAREALAPYELYYNPLPEWVARLIALVRAERDAELLAGAGEPMAHFDVAVNERIAAIHYRYKSASPKLTSGDRLYTADQLAAAVLRATLAERERCAKVADELFAATGRTFDHRAVAAAIRAGGAA